MESEIYLRYLIMNQHILASPIEKIRAFWSKAVGGTHDADRHLQDTRSGDHTENRPQTTASDGIEPRGMTAKA